MKRVVSGISVPIVILGSSINTETGVDKKIGLLLIEEIITLRYSADYVEIQKAPSKGS